MTEIQVFDSAAVAVRERDALKLENEALKTQLNKEAIEWANARLDAQRLRFDNERLRMLLTEGLEWIDSLDLLERIRAELEKKT